LARSKSTALGKFEFHGESAAVARAQTQAAPGGVEWPEPWSSLPSTLQARSLSPVAIAPLQVSGLQWAWLGMALLLVFALRQKPVGALIVGLVLACALFLLPIPSRSVAPVVSVLEGDASSGRWLEVRGAQDGLVVTGSRPGWLRRLPAGAVGNLECLADATERWAAQFPEARLYFSTEIEIKDLPSGSSPGDRDLLRAWVRLPGEGWSFRGPWARQESLPGAILGGPAPPGWLAAGLPQGVGVLLGECKTSSTDQGWLRLVGFQE
jgi:hypothetical protein